MAPAGMCLVKRSLLPPPTSLWTSPAQATPCRASPWPRLHFSPLQALGAPGLVATASAGVPVRDGTVGPSFKSIKTVKVVTAVH